ncbi:MAG: Rpp14/Pop5 family protein [Candidatus Woesearchaeota archaeon]
MQKLKLLPSLKEKKRYLVYEVIMEKNIHNTDKKISDYIDCWLGVVESSKASIIFIGYSKENRRGIIKATNNYVDRIKLVLSLINKIDNINVIIRSIYVSGLLNKAKNLMFNKKCLK